MTIRTETLVDVDGWRVKEIYTDGEFSHYVLNHPMETGHATNPFDTVRASGGLLSLMRDGGTSVTFTGVVDGSNEYRDESDMPHQVFAKLKSIGPY